MTPKEVASLETAEKTRVFQENEVEFFPCSIHTGDMMQTGLLGYRSEILPANTKRFFRGRIARARLGLACFTVLFLACAAQAQIFMSVGGQPGQIGANPQPTPKLPGESTDAQYPRWIQLGSAQLGVGRAVALNNGTISASAPSVSEVTITKVTDSTTPSLYTLVCGGTTAVSQPIDYVTIDFRKGGSNEVYYRLQLQNVYVTGVSSSSGGDVPSESLTLFFTKITWTYVPYDQYSKAQTPITRGWDVVKNAAF